ncbi:MAG: radical SAM protein [Candidatus Nanoarchaeia archaeon]|nr:radical SAM protein [Candidatus Nanoarchaeia archaeon]MDD5054203.1 radical SAM protein [Candidatus Nanoarchaeia archaeon]MDD5499829.1 radical SAM protein [Candidatus Nanoarchaeia archaeon]
MNKKLSFTMNYLLNKLKVCEFALTNVCSCKCSFCSIWKQKPKITVKTSEAIKAIKKLKSLGVGFITLTGGEPLLHPDFDKIIRECNNLGIMNAMLNADARIFTPKVLDKLEKDKPEWVSISIDHHTDKIEYISRKIPNLLNHIKNAVDELKKRKIKTLGSIVICNYNHKSLKELCDKCMEIGFEQIAINYPEISESEVYELGGNAITLTKKQVIKALETVKTLKKKYPIINTDESINNIIDYLSGKNPKYYCFGGSKVFFIDWNLNTYPCMHLNKNMGNILKLTKKDFNMKPCNCCNMSWYRDFSVYFYGAKSLIPLLKELPKAIKY